MLDAINATNYTMDSKTYIYDAEDAPQSSLAVTIESESSKLHEYGTAFGSPVDVYYAQEEENIYLYVNDGTKWIKQIAPANPSFGAIGDSRIGNVTLRSILSGSFDQATKQGENYIKQNYTFTINAADLLEIIGCAGYTPNVETLEMTYEEVAFSFENGNFKSIRVESHGFNVSRNDELHTVELSILESKSRAIYENFRNIGSTVVTLPEIA